MGFRTATLKLSRSGAFVTDLETVVDAAGLNHFALLGISQGCAVAVAYAVRHPQRVRRLILLGGYAVGWAKRTQSAAEKERSAAMLTLMRLGWGQENPAFRQLFTSQFIPGGTKEQADWFNELQRISASPEDAARNLIANGDADVSPLLAQISVPTLVMHSRDDASVPFEQSRRLAAGITAGAVVCPFLWPPVHIPSNAAAMWTCTGNASPAASPARSIMRPMPIRPEWLATLINEDVGPLAPVSLLLPLHELETIHLVPL
jgi:pimeloyl-ACP methyl ester carboxylesterase